MRRGQALALGLGPGTDALILPDGVRAGSCRYPRVALCAVVVATLAFLFTDIEGTMAVLQRVGDGAYAGTGRSSRVVRTALAAHDGREVVMRGDGFLAVFSSPRACVAAVLEMQQALAEHVWPVRRSPTAPCAKPGRRFPRFGAR
jgi:class 3 adenylate cyclase